MKYAGLGTMEGISRRGQGSWTIAPVDGEEAYYHTVKCNFKYTYKLHGKYTDFDVDNHPSIPHSLCTNFSTLQ
jgi:hypothetical protein